jgi:lysyl-tRNA synthetase class 2
MLRETRAFFENRHVLEVSTPSLCARTSVDPNIESIVARLCDRDLYLHTSPEHFMKRLLAAGYPDIYQVCRVYRDGEVGRLHLPEFTMIEWYRRGVGLQAIMQEAAALATCMLAKKKLILPPRRVTYRQAFSESLSLDPLLADTDTIIRSIDGAADLAESLGDNHDAWLDLAMATRVATTFPADRLTLVYHYPASQAALARLCPEDPSVADRFELYFGSIELANGFVELTDATEQRRRFESDLETRTSSGLKHYEIDDALIDALHSGMPAAAGVALGLDRLLMIDEDADDIRAVTSFTPGT